MIFPSENKWANIKNQHLFNGLLNSFLRRGVAGDGGLSYCIYTLISQSTRRF